MNKKLLILVGIAVVLIIGIIVVFILGGVKKNNTSTDSNNNPQQLPLGRNITPSPIPQSDLSAFNGAFFTFQYPSGIEILQSGTQGGEQTVVLSINTNPQSKIEISAYEKSQTSAQKLGDIMAGFGFSGSPIPLKNFPAMRYSGALTMPEGSLQETATIFEQGSKSYKIQLMYVSNDSIPEIESIYSQIVSTFVPR